MSNKNILYTQNNLVISGSVTVDRSGNKDYYNYFDGITGQNQYMVILFPLTPVKAESGFKLKSELIKNVFFKNYDNTPVPEAISKIDVLKDIYDKISNSLLDSTKFNIYENDKKNKIASKEFSIIKEKGNYYLVALADSKIFIGSGKTQELGRTTLHFNNLTCKNKDGKEKKKYIAIKKEKSDKDDLDLELRYLPKQELTTIVNELEFDENDIGCYLRLVDIDILDHCCDTVQTTIQALIGNSGNIYHIGYKPPKLIGYINIDKEINEDTPLDIHIDKEFLQ